MFPPMSPPRTHETTLANFVCFYFFIYATGECSPVTKWRSLDSIQRRSTSCWWILYRRMTTDTNSRIINGRHAWGTGTRPLGLPGRGEILQSTARPSVSVRNVGLQEPHLGAVGCSWEKWDRNASEKKRKNCRNSVAINESCLTMRLLAIVELMV